MRPSLIAAGLLLLGACSGEVEPDGPRTIVFGNLDQCTQLTDRACDFQMCDFIPEGKTLDETCGPYWQEGIAPFGELSIDDVDQVLWYYADCAADVQIVDQRMTVEDPVDDPISVSGPTAWLEQWRHRYETLCDI